MIQTIQTNQPTIITVEIPGQQGPPGIPGGQGVGGGGPITGDITLLVTADCDASKNAMLYTVPAGKRALITGLLFRDSTLVFVNQIDDALPVKFSNSTQQYNAGLFAVNPVQDVYLRLENVLRGTAGDILAFSTLADWGQVGTFKTDVFGILLPA